MPFEVQTPLSTDELVRFLDQFASCVMIADKEGDIRFCNHIGIMRLGYDPEEIGKLNIGNILPHIGNELIRAGEMHKRQDSAHNPAIIYNVLTKHGNYLKSTVYVQRMRSADQNPCFLIQLPDIVEEKAVQLVQQFSGTFMRDANLGVLIINSEFHLIDISHMACKVLGVDRENVLNKPLDEVFAAVPQEHRLVQRTILDGVAVRNHAVSWTNNQERFELLMDAHTLRNDEGRVVGAYVIFKDVTNLRSLEEQVQRSDRLAMIGQIAAGTAHEIRNPLTSIKGFLQVLNKTLQDQGLLREYEYTNIMLMEIDRINDLVSEFLMLSKPRNSDFRHVDISGVIRDILPIIHNEAILHDVSVEYRSAPDLPQIVADRELLKQVFLNICKNGIEAMKDGGELTITEKADPEEQRVNIEIRDTGPGIAAFLIDKIFDPFFTTKDSGTGLGLSVCQRIIHDINGSIRVSSKGYGTTFTISIPYSI